MRLATALYLVGIFLFILFTDALAGISGQSLAYGPLTAAMLVLVLVAMASGPRNFLQRWYVESPISAAGLLFLLGLAISLPNSRDLGLALKDFVRWTFIWMVFAPATRAVCSDERQCTKVARVAGILILAFGAMAVGDLMSGGRVTPGLIGRQGINAAGRYMSVYGNAGIFAGMLTVGLPLVLVPALSPGRWTARLAWGAGATLIGGAMLLTGTRITLLTAAVACVIIFGAQRRWWVVIGVGLAIAAAVLAPTDLLVKSAPTVGRVQETMTSTGSGQRSLERRLLIWSLAADMIAESPVFGRGGSQLRFAQHAGFKRAHNAWLDAWIDGGLPAAVAVMLVTVLVLRRTWLTLAGRSPQFRHPTHVALVAASCAVLVGWTVRAGIGGRIDWLPIFMMHAMCWDRTPARGGIADETPEHQSAADSA